MASSGGRLSALRLIYSVIPTNSAKRTASTCGKVVGYIIRMIAATSINDFYQGNRRTKYCSPKAPIQKTATNPPDTVKAISQKVDTPRAIRAG